MFVVLLCYIFLFVSKCCFLCEVIYRNFWKLIVGVVFYNSDRIECVCVLKFWSGLGIFYSYFLFKLLC